MICIGNQTAAWAATVVEPFDYAVAQGFNAFEWFPDKKPGAGWDETDLDATARQRIRDMGKSRGIRFSVHARWQADLLAPKYCTRGKVRQGSADAACTGFARRRREGLPVGQVEGPAQHRRDLRTERALAATRSLRSGARPSHRASRFRRNAR